MTNTSLRWGREYNNARESEKRLQCILSDIRRYSVSEHPTAMDLGANTGFFSLGLADAGFRVAAVEPPSDKSMSYVGVTEYRHWVQYREDLPEGPFDVSLVLSVLHHIPAWMSVLNGVLERTESLVYVEVPHPERVRLSRDAARALFAHDWPLNVRQLENALIAATSLAGDNEIDTQVAGRVEGSHRLA